MKRLIFAILSLLGVRMVTAATVTYNLLQESNAGTGGAIQWQSVFLLNDGRIASFGAGNHYSEQTNAMRIIDPFTLTTYDAFPWTQNVNPPNMTGGQNLYVTSYDNHPSIYIPSDNKAVWVGHGVFDFAVNSWTYGNRSPNTQGWNQFLDDAAASWITGVYNPVVGWSSQLDAGVWFGTSAGGLGYPNQYFKITRNSSGKPWRFSFGTIPAISGVERARNCGAVVGKYLYMDGGDVRGFWKVDLETMTLAATLTPYNRPSGEYFPQLVYDSGRGKLVMIGKRLFEFDLAGGVWSDVTPSGWPGYTSPMGVYHPGLNKIFFRGIPTGSTGGSQDFKWHSISFGAAPPPDSIPPSAPLGLAVLSVAVNLSWQASTDNVGVAGYKVFKNGLEIGQASATQFSVAGLTSGSYLFEIKAIDAAGNISPSSNVISVQVP